MLKTRTVGSYFDWGVDLFRVNEELCKPVCSIKRLFLAEEYEETMSALSLKNDDDDDI